MSRNVAERRKRSLVRQLDSNRDFSLSSLDLIRVQDHGPCGNLDARLLAAPEQTAVIVEHAGAVEDRLNRRGDTVGAEKVAMHRKRLATDLQRQNTIRKEHVVHIRLGRKDRADAL